MIMFEVTALTADTTASGSGGTMGLVGMLVMWAVIIGVMYCLVTQHFTKGYVS